MGKLLRGLVAMVVLGAGSAFAAPCNDVHGATPVAVRATPYEGYGLSVAPPPPAGHYVTREVRQWVRGYWTMKYVEGHRARRVFIPGHYQLVAQRVWVGGPAYGVQVAPPPPARFG